MREPLAYLITWTCYGQWLRGDRRGYVDRRHRTPGTPYPWNHTDFFNADAVRMRESHCWLTDDQRKVAEAAMRAACEFRGWHLHAVNVQPDHVHLVVKAVGYTGKQARARLKDRATRQLKAAAPGRQKWWTEGGKVDLIFDKRHLKQAIDYVNNRQPFPRV